LRGGKKKRGWPSREGKKLDVHRPHRYLKRQCAGVTTNFSGVTRDDGKKKERLTTGDGNCSGSAVRHKWGGEGRKGRKGEKRGREKREVPWLQKGKNSAHPQTWFHTRRTRCPDRFWGKRGRNKTKKF